MQAKDKEIQRLQQSTLRSSVIQHTQSLLEAELASAKTAKKKSTEKYCTRLKQQEEIIENLESRVSELESIE